MPITTITCYRADCDECGNPLLANTVDDGEVAPHWETPELALANIYGDPDIDRDDTDSRYLQLVGQQLSDGRLLCGRCNAKRLLAERGHNWSEWVRCNCYDPAQGRRLIDRHEQAGQCHEYRTCDRAHCWKREERPAATAA